MQNLDLEDLFSNGEADEVGSDAQVSSGSAKVVDLKRRRRIEDHQEERRLRQMLEDPWG